MGSQRAHIVMPKDLIDEIDSLVGVRGRSAFLVETAQAEVKRRKLLAFLLSDVPVMRDEDHPELAAVGSQEWVKALRRGDEERLHHLHDADRAGK